MTVRVLKTVFTVFNIDVRGDTKIPLNMGISEHKTSTRLGLMGKLDIAKHIWPENREFN